MPRLPIRTCDLYTPGHQVHWIPPLRVYVDASRRPVRVEDVTPDGWCTVLDGGQVLRWWVHDPLRLADLVALDDGQMLRVGESTFLTTPVRNGCCYWVYLAEAATPCRKRQPPDGRAAGEPLSAQELLAAAKDMGGVTAQIQLSAPPDPGARRSGQ
jgi:hypothetical protein